MPDLPPEPVGRQSVAPPLHQAARAGDGAPASADEHAATEQEIINGGQDAAQRATAPQPDARNGVSESMATVAIFPEGSRVAPQPPVHGAKKLGGRHESLAGETHRTGMAAGEEHIGNGASLAGMDDAAVMLQLRSGNMDAFDVLLKKYRKPIVHFMFRMVHNQAVAEELAQEVFLRVYRSRETYRAEAKFSTWLYRIATNLGVNQARDTRHERTAATVYLDQPDAETGVTPDVADLTPGVENRLLRDERMRAIREHVMGLPERQRNAVLMHKYEGLDYRQIGDVLKLSESATKSLLFRAYQTLREKLKDFI